MQTARALSIAAAVMVAVVWLALLVVSAHFDGRLHLLPPGILCLTVGAALALATTGFAGQFQNRP